MQNDLKKKRESDVGWGDHGNYYKEGVRMPFGQSAYREKLIQKGKKPMGVHSG